MRSPEDTLPRTNQATGSVVGTAAVGPTRAEVESWVDARMRQNLEKQNDAIGAAVKDTFIDQLNISVLYLEEEGVETDLY